ncbi:glycosyltransferase family 2 protein [Pseudomonas argentinensis]|uniref:Glycosyltransferase, GT2 family n=1 Tax=Phytopseudomonas argentinensis TaxID=289370 RepID=A0A1I3HZB2_9GAMM|nr:glycosyltransferase [Pseudomonas argentinensis]KAB0548049.1 glycosyltransferase family 2 protein [Pseudomonas argentinensis]SFI40929.1 Glycosyltransferase, GT2 family [Pseudomonas argentinensis]
MKANTNTPITGLVLHFRTPEKTLVCLRSLQQEGIRKVIVVDNSEDGGQSIAAMQDDLDALHNAGFDTEVLNPGRNLGFAAGVNMGLAHIAASQASHVLLINSDAQLTPCALSHMRRALQTAAIVAPRIAQGNETHTSPFAYYDRLLGLITRKPYAMPLRHASGCCLLVRVDQAHAPLFDQDFFFYGEDVMLGFTTEQNQIAEQECPQASASHATSSSAKNGSLFYEYHINRSHWLLACKLARNRLELCAFITARCMTLPLRALIRSLRFRSLVAWKGLLMATFDVLCGRCRSLTPPPTTTNPHHQPTPQ